MIACGNISDIVMMYFVHQWCHVFGSSVMSCVLFICVVTRMCLSITDVMIMYLIYQWCHYVFAQWCHEDLFGIFKDHRCYQTPPNDATATKHRHHYLWCNLPQDTTALCEAVQHTLHWLMQGLFRLLIFPFFSSKGMICTVLLLQILSLASELFYESRLVHCHVMKPGGPRHIPPLVFHSVTGQEERDPDSPSFYNSQEVQAVVDEVLLTSSCDVTSFEWVCFRHWPLRELDSKVSVLFVCTSYPTLWPCT